MLSDRAVRIFLNAKGRIDEETVEVCAFSDYMNSLAVTDSFAAEVAAAVERIKANGEERKKTTVMYPDNTNTDKLFS